MNLHYKAFFIIRDHSNGQTPKTAALYKIDEVWSQSVTALGLVILTSKL